MLRLHMSHRHLNTLSGSGAEVYRMMCEAIKAAQKLDEMSWNNSDHTVQPKKKTKKLERRGWLVSTGPSVSFSSIRLLARSQRERECARKHRTAMAQCPLTFWLDGDTVWIRSWIWDQIETGYWGFILRQKYSTCYNAL